MAANNLLMSARQSTQDLHQQLDSSYPFSSVQCIEINLESYSEMLKLLYLWHQNVAPHLNAASSFLGLSETQFLCARNDLEQDLDYPQSTIAHAKEASPSNSIGYSVGVLYVFLGSAHGACHILKDLQRKAPNAPRRYFTNQAQRISLWREFVQQLAVCNEVDVSAMKQGACDAFYILLNLAKGVNESTLKACN